MSAVWPEIIDADELSTFELASALEVGADDESWGRRAAVLLLINQRSWLDRSEFRQAVEVDVDGDGQVRASVDWDTVDSATVSSGERSLLEIARYLAGIAGCRPLEDLLSGLDDYDLCRVMAALNIAANDQRGSLR